MDNQTDQRLLIEWIEYDIKSEQYLISQMESIIKKHISKDNYTDTDNEIVKYALQIIDNSKRNIKKLEGELLLIAKYPVGSKQRPGFFLKEVYGKERRQG